MPWVFLLLALVLIVAFGLTVAGRLPSVPQPTRERYVARLPQDPSPADVDQLRLPVAFRGYRMDEVDEALMTLRNRIAQLEAATVAAHAAGPPPAGPAAGSPFAPPPVGDDGV